MFIYIHVKFNQDFTIQMLNVFQTQEITYTLKKNRELTDIFPLIIFR